MTNLLKTLTSIIVEQVKWTEPILRDIAQDYKSRVDFRNGNSKAYRAALRIDKVKPGFFDDITSHMQILWRKKWNYDTIFNLAKKYKKKVDFRSNEPNAYTAAYEHGFMERLSNELNWPKPKEWSKENIQKVALDYETKVNFQKNEPSAYQIAWRNKWLEDITKHMIPVGNLLKRMIYAWEFPDKTVYVGLTGDKKKRSYNHNNNPKSPVYKYKKLTGLEPTFVPVIDEYIDAADAQAEEENTKLQYESNGWKILNSAKTGGLGGSIIKWTTEEIWKEAKKYKTRVDFQQNAPGAYNASRNLKIYDKVTSHMDWLGGTVWTYDILKNEAEKYQTRTDFHKGNKNAYAAANSRGILDDITRHMNWLGGENWSWEKIIELTKHYMDFKDFRKDYPGAVSWVYQNQLTDELKKLLNYRWEQKWDYDSVRKEATKYNTRNDFLTKSSGAAQAAKNNGWWDEVTSHMPILRNDYNVEDAINVISKYEDLRTFRSENPNLYSWIHQNKLWKQLLSNLTRSVINWTPELINQELKKYSTYSEFKKNSRKAYNILRYRKNLQLAKDYYNNL